MAKDPEGLRATEKTRTVSKESSLMGRGQGRRVQIVEKTLKMLADRYNLFHGCKAPFQVGFGSSGQSHLAPFAFHTIESTSLVQI